MPNDGIKLCGTFIILDTPTGEVLREIPNIVVNPGLSWVKRRVIGGTVPACMGFIACGSSSDTASAGQTALHAQIGIKSASVGDTGSYQCTWSTTFASGSATGTWKEVGVFTANSGSMLCRAAFSDLTKAQNDSFTVRYIFLVADDGV